jgi:hypothetical protein
MPFCDRKGCGREIDEREAMTYNGRCEHCYAGIFSSAARHYKAIEPGAEMPSKSVARPAQAVLRGKGLLGSKTRKPKEKRR